MLNRFKEGVARIKAFLQPQTQFPDRSFPERCKNAGIDASKIPELFLDAQNFEIMDKILVIDQVVGHAIDESTLVTLFAGINPFNGEKVIFSYPDMKMNFNETELEEITKTLLDVRLSPTLRLGPVIDIYNLKQAILNFNLHTFEDFDVPALKLMARCCKDCSEGLRLKIDFYIKKKLEMQLLEQRNTFITHVEKLKKLQELHTKANDINPMDEEQRFNLFLIKLELIGEYASFIVDTKAAIDTLEVTSDKKLEEIKRVLTEDYQSYNNVISFFMRWATAEEKRLAGVFEKVYLEDRLAGVVIPHYENLVRIKVAEYEKMLALRKIHLSSLQSCTHFKPQLRKEAAEPIQEPPRPKSP